MTKEALKLALEALETPWNAPYVDGCDLALGKKVKAITAIKEALAQPEQEPVAWRAWVSKFPQGTGSDWVYVTKPIMKDSVHNQPLYTTPPQRTWVGLTDKDWNRSKHNYDFQKGVDWAESILKEKNT